MSVKVALTHTEATRQGETKIDQCSNCGALVAWEPRRRKVLGTCPSCGASHWWRQRLPVGPFKAKR